MAAPEKPDAAFSFADWMRTQLHTVEAALDAFVAPGAPADLGLAMRYGVLDGGKRLRAMLVLAAQQALAAAAAAGEATADAQAAWHAAAVRSACAVELIHAYSLIHDDMPCMDNDVLRRGKPTVHVQFGEATALLAGDAMQALAFELLVPLADATGIAPRTQAALCGLLARAAGPAGMAGGQAIDLANVGQSMDRAALQHMHELKTGALLQASVMMGAHCVPDGAPATLQALQGYGQALGLAFQVVDDILDATSDSTTLGKTAGKDEADNKPTYVSLMGVAAARSYAQELHAQAMAALQASGLSPAARAPLAGLADMVVHRTH